MTTSPQADDGRDHATVDSGSSTDQQISGFEETGSFTTDEEPTGGTPAHGSSNVIFNETGGNRVDRTDS